MYSSSHRTTLTRIYSSLRLLGIGSHLLSLCDRNLNRQAVVSQMHMGRQHLGRLCMQACLVAHVYDIGLTSAYSMGECYGILYRLMRRMGMMT